VRRDQLILNTRFRIALPFISYPEFGNESPMNRERRAIRVLGSKGALGEGESREKRVTRGARRGMSERKQLHHSPALLLRSLFGRMG